LVAQRAESAPCLGRARSVLRIDLLICGAYHSYSTYKLQCGARAHRPLDTICRSLFNGQPQDDDDGEYLHHSFNMPWQPLPLSYAVAIYPFQPSSSPSELPLQIGDQLYVIEQGGKDGSWCRGYLVAPPSLLSALSPGAQTAADARVFSGIFPKCCIEIREELGSGSSAETRTADPGGAKPPAPVPMLKIGDESPTSSAEPLVDEISSCLREWYILHLPDLALRREYALLEQMSSITTRLDYARRQLLNDVLTKQERVGVREQAVWDLVRGNKMLSGEVIVRDPQQQGRLLTADDSMIEMAKLQSIMSVLDDAPAEKAKTTSLHHCLVEIKSVIGSELESLTLSFALYFKDMDNRLTPFSETYTALASLQMKTLLADLSKRDVGSDGRLYLVAKVIVQEPIKNARKTVTESLPSRNGTLRGNRELVLNRRRSSLMFGKKRQAERPAVARSGQMTPQLAAHRAPTPSIQEEPEEETDVVNQQGGNHQPPSAPPVPRTRGVGMIDIAEVIREGHPADKTINIWSAENRGEEHSESWDPLIAALLPSPSKHYSISAKIPRINLRLTPFIAPDAEALIRNNPTSMHMVSRTQKMGFSEAPSKPRSDIYLRLVRAAITQGSQLSHPEFGVAPIKALSLLNLQLTMEVRDTSGRRVEQCIYPSSNGAGVTAFRTNATELLSDWDQTVCLRIPTEKVPECHLILSVADAPEFPFALAWMPLWDNQAFVSDGTHSLILHVYDKVTSSIVQGRGAYLSLPWVHSHFAAGHDAVGTSVAALEVETVLCSTEYSQNRTLVSLIHWKHQSSVQLLDILQKLAFVPEIEIVKQLQDVLDALFGLLVHKSGESKFEDLIFNDIVFVLGIVHDRRYNLGPLVEQYTENHFRSPYAASCLIRSFTRLLQSVSDPQSARDMRALFKVGSQFMKIVIASYQQRRFGSQNNNADEKHLSTFKEDMQAILFGLQMMMRSETAALVGSKTLLVQNFHTWLPELLPAFGKDEVIEIAIEFLDSSEDARGKLALYRLILILNYAKLDRIWVDQKDKDRLIQNCVRWLLPYWTPNDWTDDWREQVRLCCSVVAQLTRYPTTRLHEFMPKLIAAYCHMVDEPVARKRSLSLLFSSSYPFTVKTGESNDPFDEALLELAALISTISKIKAPASVELGGQDLSIYILSTLTVLRSLLNADACPSTWLSLHISHHSSALTILTYLSTLLASAFLPSPEDAESFEMQLWKAYLDTVLVLVSSPALTLESFPEQKRRAVWKIAGDVRQSGADLLRRSWESLGWEATADDQRRYNIRKLGGYQVQYVPSLVGPIVELCLSMHEGLRKVAVEILQTMIVSEWALSEDLDLIETEIIGALNTALKTKNGGANEAMSRKLFIAELLDLFATIANQPDDALWTALEELVATVEELVDLLTNADNGEDEGDGANATATAAVDAEAKELERARRSIEGVSTTRDRDAREYGVHALECYKQLAEEYERNGDYKRLAKTHRAIARIHEARAASRLGERGVNGHGVMLLEEEEYDEQ